MRSPHGIATSMGHMDVDVAALLLPCLVSWPETGRRVSPPRGRCMSNADVLINGRMGSSTRSIELGCSMLYCCQKSIECMQVVYVKVDENKPIVGAPPRSTPPLGALHPDSFTSIEKQCRCTPSTLRARMPDRKVMFGRRWPSISRRREVCLQS